MLRASKEKRAVLVPNPQAKFSEQVREVMRFHHYSYRTEKTYQQWIHRFLLFHRRPDRCDPDRGWRHPREMGGPELASFLAHLAVTRNVAASTQNQALNALVFFYEEVLQVELGI